MDYDYIDNIIATIANMNPHTRRVIFGYDTFAQIVRNLSAREIEKRLEQAEKIPEKKKEYWVDGCACSKCGWHNEDDRGNIIISRFKFCPNCGKEMHKEP